MPTVIVGDDHFAAGFTRLGGGSWRAAFWHDSFWRNSALLDPRPQNRDLLALEWIGIGRHPLGSIAGFQPTDHFAVSRPPGNNGPAAGIGRSQLRGTLIEPHAALLLFRPVALDAVARQQRSHIAVEIDFC